MRGPLSVSCDIDALRLPPAGRWSSSRGDVASAGLHHFDLLRHAAARVCGAGRFGVVTKSPTYDEPLGALSAVVALRRHDYRIDYDNPPLWKYWAALPNLALPLNVAADDPQWALMHDDQVREWVVHESHAVSRYGEPAGDADRAVAVDDAGGCSGMRGGSRGVGVHSGRPLAAVVAVACFALDPNFLAPRRPCEERRCRRRVAAVDGDPRPGQLVAG